MGARVARVHFKNSPGHERHSPHWAQLGGLAAHFLWRPLGGARVLAQELLATQSVTSALLSVLGEAGRLLGSEPQGSVRSAALRLPLESRFRGARAAWLAQTTRWRAQPVERRAEVPGKELPVLALNWPIVARRRQGRPVAPATLAAAADLASSVGAAAAAAALALALAATLRAECL
mgnify:CR=1 FL=1